MPFIVINSMDINNMFMCAIPDQPFFHQKTLFFFFSSFFYFYFYNVWFSIGQLLQFGFLYAHKTHTQTRAETLNWEWQTSFSFEFFIFVIFIMRIICAVNMFYSLLLLFLSPDQTVNWFVRVCMEMSQLISLEPLISKCIAN